MVAFYLLLRLFENEKVLFYDCYLVATYRKKNEIGKGSGRQLSSGRVGHCPVVELYNRADCVEWNNNNNTKEKRVRISVRDRGRPGFCTMCLSSVCRTPPASLSLSPGSCGLF